MAIFSDLELMGIMNEAKKDDESSFDKFKDRVEDNIDKMKDTGEKMNNNLKNNLWINKHKQKKKTGKITFKEDADGNIIDCIIDGESIEEGKHEHKFELKIGDGPSKKKKEKVTGHKHYDYEFGLGNRKVRDSFDRKYIKYENDDESIEEGLGLLSKKNMKKVDQAKRDLTNKAAVEFEKEKQEWESEPGAKTGEAIGDVITGGNIVNTIGKKTGRFTGSVVDKVIAKKNKIIIQTKLYVYVYSISYFSSTRSVLFVVILLRCGNAYCQVNMFSCFETRARQNYNSYFLNPEP